MGTRNLPVLKVGRRESKTDSLTAVIELVV
jgi:hypothetical protein